MSSILEFINRPYSSDMTALKWFAFMGMILLFLFAWSRIINMISGK